MKSFFSSPILLAVITTVMLFTSCGKENSTPEALNEVTTSYQKFVSKFALHEITTIKVGDESYQLHESLSNEDLLDLEQILEEAPHLVVDQEANILQVMDHVLSEDEIQALADEKTNSSQGAESRSWGQPIGYTLNLCINGCTRWISYTGVAYRDYNNGAYHATRSIPVMSPFKNANRLDYYLDRKLSRATKKLDVRLQRPHWHGGGFDTFKNLQLVIHNSSPTRRCSDRLQGSHWFGNNSVTQMTIQYNHENWNCW